VRGPTFTPHVRRGYGTHLDVAQHNLGKVGVHHLDDEVVDKESGRRDRARRGCFVVEVGSQWDRRPCDRV